MSRIRVHFSYHPSRPEGYVEDAYLEWTLRDIPLADRFLKALQIAIDYGIIYEQDRFFNFKNGFYTKDRVVDLINQSIDTINKFSPGLITQRVDSTMTQSEMNHFHTYFEKHRGPLLNPAPMYKNGSTELKSAFDQLNLMIHRYEGSGFCESDMANEDEASFAITFGLNEVNKRYPLREHDYKFFSMEKNFGDMAINYCEVGKSLVDLWRDGDEEIGAEAIMPLHYYSADVFVQFNSLCSRDRASIHLQEFNEWWDSNSEKLRKLGFEKDDPKNAIGSIVIAELDGQGLSQDECIDLVSKRQWVKAVEIL